MNKKKKRDKKKRRKLETATVSKYPEGWRYQPAPHLFSSSSIVKNIYAAAMLLTW